MGAMKKFLGYMILLGTFTSSAASYMRPDNHLFLLKQQIIRYHDSGAYIAEIKKQADQAESYLKKRIEENESASLHRKLAMVLDIDETSLSNYNLLKRIGFGSVSSNMSKRINQSIAIAPIAPTLQCYQYAISHHVTVFFITGRKENTRTRTLKTLVALGYKSAGLSTKNCENAEVSPKCVLYLRDGKYLQGSAILYKSAMRKKIERAGYDIVVNIGDQYSDLAGGYSESIYKYPNYMYYIP